MSCPNDPPCAHSLYMHDLGELDLSDLDDGWIADLANLLPSVEVAPRCWILGCSCGARREAGLPAAAPVPAPREPADDRGMCLPGGCPCDGLAPASSAPAAVEPARPVGEGEQRGAQGEA